MGIRREELERMNDRQLECLLAQIVYHWDREALEVRGEFLCNRYASRDKDPSIIGRSIPRFVTSWEGFGQALERIDACNFNVELHCPADRSALMRAVVTMHRNEEATRGEASHANLRRALVVAAILAMYEAYEYGY